MSKIFSLGRKGAPFLVITDWSTPDAELRGQHLSDRQNNFLMGKLRKHSISPQDCVFLNPCPINVAWVRGKSPTEKQHGEWVGQYREEFLAKYEPLARSCKAVLVLGKSAARQVFGKPVKVTKARGSFSSCPITSTPVMVTLSPAHVQSRLEMEQDFDTDMSMVAALAENKFDTTAFAKSVGDYQITMDLSHLLKKPPKYLAVDTETTSLYWAKDASVICVPITYEAGHSLVVPVHGGMFSDIPRADRMRVVGQLRRLLANPEVRVFGHNFKFDKHMLALLNIEVANWWMDTLQLAFALDENMQSKSLKECVRRWVPSMAGYSDEFDEQTDKSNMLSASREDLVRYAGGDTDATFRLAKVQLRELKKDKQQYATVKHVQMPALRMFYRMERQGMKVSRKRLLTLSTSIQSESAKLEAELLRMVPKAVKQKHYDKGLSFTRKEFLADILFTKEGFRLKPINFVKTGAPATDKTHLLNFTDNEFVVKYMELQKIKKMQSTYIGVDSQLEAKPIALLKNGGFPAAVKRIADVHPDDLQEIAIRDVQAVDAAASDIVNLTVCAEGETACIARSDDGEFFVVADSGATGFWKHMCDDGKIHPSFFLHKAVTGRSSSSDPNFQNIPKRGALASRYRRIFIPSRKGNVLLEADLSQAELRIAACESLDPVMMQVYREGGDIHLLSASKAARVPISEVTKEMRQKAKAMNFGFLYTMGVDGFIIYAKTNYGVTFTKKEAQQIRDTYFATYAKLKTWHDRRRSEVRRNGFVRGLHGARRNLPSINSSDQGVQAEAERQAINSPVQRFASDCTLLSMVQFSEGCPDWVLPVGTVHDSGIAECPESKHLKVAGWLRWCMANPPLERLFGLKLPIPMDADVAVGPDLGTMTELKVEAVKPPWIK